MPSRAGGIRDEFQDKGIRPVRREPSPQDVFFDDPFRRFGVSAAGYTSSCRSSSISGKASQEEEMGGLEDEDEDMIHQSREHPNLSLDRVEEGNTERKHRQQHKLKEKWQSEPRKEYDDGPMAIEGKTRRRERNDSRGGMKGDPQPNAAPAVVETSLSPLSEEGVNEEREETEDSIPTFVSHTLLAGSTSMMMSGSPGNNPPPAGYTPPAAFLRQQSVASKSAQPESRRTKEASSRHGDPAATPTRQALDVLRAAAANAESAVKSARKWREDNNDSEVFTGQRSGQPSVRRYSSQDHRQVQNRVRDDGMETPRSKRRQSSSENRKSKMILMSPGEDDAAPAKQAGRERHLASGSGSSITIVSPDPKPLSGNTSLASALNKGASKEQLQRRALDKHAQRPAADPRRTVVEEDLHEKRAQQVVDVLMALRKENQRLQKQVNRLEHTVEASSARSESDRVKMNAMEKRLATLERMLSETTAVSAAGKGLASRSARSQPQPPQPIQDRVLDEEDETLGPGSVGSSFLMNPMTVGRGTQQTMRRKSVDSQKEQGSALDSHLPGAIAVQRHSSSHEKSVSSHRSSAGVVVNPNKWQEVTTTVVEEQTFC